MGAYRFGQMLAIIVMLAFLFVAVVKAVLWLLSMSFVKTIMLWVGISVIAWWVGCTAGNIAFPLGRRLRVSRQ